MEIDYYKIPKISASLLKLVAEDPDYGLARLQFALDNLGEDNSSPAKDFGRLVHMLLFEPQNLGKDFVLSPYPDFRTKDAKAWRDQQSVNGRTIIKDAELLEAEEMIRALRIENKYVNQDKLAKVQHLFANGELEVEEVFQWEEKGLECKCKVDAYSPTLNLIIEYKTVQSLKKNKLESDFYNFGYHIAQAHYVSGVKHCLGLEENPGFLYIAQEKSKPYLFEIYEPSDQALLESEEQRLEILDKISNRDPLNLTSSDIQVLDLPNWAYANREKLQEKENG